MKLQLSTLIHSRAFFDQRPSRAGTVFTLTLIVLLGATVLWASLAEVDDVIKATALLRPEAAISSVRAASSGMLTHKGWNADQLVQPGDLLWETDVTADRLELVHVARSLAQVDGELREQQLLISSMVAGKNMAPSQGAVQGVWLRVQAYLTERERLQYVVLLARDKHDREKLTPEALRSEQRVRDLFQEWEQARLTALSWESTQKLQANQDLQALTQTRQGLERRKADLDVAIRNATVRAPIAGKIYELRDINPGDYLMAGEEILRIIPGSSSSLKAELQVSPGDVARIYPGLALNLRFPGLPPSDFGQLAGVISMVPPDVSLGPGNMPLFLVDASLIGTSLKTRSGEAVNLRAGMQAEARITIARATVLRMLLHKLDFIEGAM